MMFWHDHDLSAWGWVGMSAGMVLVSGLLVVGVVLLIRYLVRPDQQDAATFARGNPQQLLAERFARGEINKDEYIDRSAVLERQFELMNCRSLNAGRVIPGASRVNSVPDD